MQATTGLALVAGIAVALAAAGCGTSSSGSVTTGGSSSPAAPTTQATVTDTVVPPTTTATSAAPTTVAGPTACATSNLTVSLGPIQGTAGSYIFPIHFANKSSAACTITAYPGVSLVAPGTGVQIGPAATRTGSAGPTITLSPGAEATSSVQLADYANFPASACAAATASGFRVYPPNNTASVYLPFTDATTKACTKVANLTVQPVVAGSGS